jgi:hypothetical protein
MQTELEEQRKTGLAAKEEYRVQLNELETQAE